MATLLLWAALRRNGHDNNGEAELLAVVTAAFGFALGSIPKPMGLSTLAPWLTSIAILALLPPWPGRAIVLGTLLTLALLSRIAEVRSIASPWPWVGGAVAAQILVQGPEWITPGLGPELLVSWLVLPGLAGFALSMGEHYSSRSTLWIVGVSLFCATGGWTVYSAAAAAVPALAGAFRHRRAPVALALAVPILAVSFYLGPHPGAAALLTVLLVGGAKRRLVIGAIAVVGGGVLIGALVGALVASSHATRLPEPAVSWLSCALAPLLLLLPALARTFQRSGRRSGGAAAGERPGRLALLSSGALVLGAAVQAESLVLATMPLALLAFWLTGTPSADRARDTGPLDSLASIQVVWSAFLLAYTTLTVGYPWLRVDPVVELADGPIAVAGLAVVCALGFIASDRRLGRVALLVAAALWILAIGLATRDAPFERLLDSPRRLDRSRRATVVSVADQEVTGIVVDAYLSNSLALADGETVVTVTLRESDGPAREHVLRNRVELGEWAARRPDVAVVLGALSPQPWRSLVSEDGTFLASQYRARIVLPEPARLRSIRIELVPALPGDPVLTLLSLRGLS